ncbi:MULTISPECIES: hypothetical protein [unclassified Massilia]|uniref:hypothetical protein n=1 Tax=unclassified Massilia TaxID=2609279 RepID=UPI001783FCB7|nr:MULTISPECIES: hypothetical protein [unclassified Massilia]MBD8533339.1 hypothetical protein [Massilia sp. CFBP 13647]MBD8676732.1 hypothetical protein [Massilia sp. CFBP 13721]
MLQAGSKACGKLALLAVAASACASVMPKRIGPIPLALKDVDAVDAVDVVDAGDVTGALAGAAGGAARSEHAPSSTITPR